MRLPGCAASRSTCAARASAIRCPGPWPSTPAPIIFGGPMSANDTDDFVRREIDWLAVPLRERKPFLGICLGAQMLAHHLGSRVFRHPDGHAEVGYYPIRPTEIGRRSAIPGPSRSTSGTGRLRPAARRRVCWRRAHSFPVQAFRYGGSGLCVPVPSGRDPRHDVPVDDPRPRAHGDAQRKPRGTHFADRAVYDPAGRAWLEAFLNHWLGNTAAAPSQQASTG